MDNETSEVELSTEETVPSKAMKFIIYVVVLFFGIILVAALSFLLGYSMSPGRYQEVEANSKTVVDPVKSDRSAISKEKIRNWKDEDCKNAAGLYCPDSYKNNTPLLIISMDGYRWDYLSRNKNPNLERMLQCGVHAPHMRPVFPTNTYPNHYSIVTGLYPESHGIIDDKIFDPQKEDFFFAWKETAYDPFWWGGEPIWTTAKKQGKTSAAIFWPGSNVKIEGHYPNKYIPYGVYMPATEQVDLILDWLTISADRPAVIAWYLDLPSRQGEVYGPDSRTIAESLTHLESLFDKLMDGLFEMNMTGCVNFIVVSGNGMQSSSCSRIVLPIHHLEEHELEITKYMEMFEGPTGRIRFTTKNITNEEIRVLARHLDCFSPHLTTYYKDDIPTRLHFSNNIRIEPIISMTELGWRTEVSFDCDHRIKGSHGYDNKHSSMQTIFIAYGPAFHQNFVAEPFENVELYNLFCELLQIEPAPNNGTKGSLSYLLKKTLWTHEHDPTPITILPSLPEKHQQEARAKYAGCPCQQTTKLIEDPEASEVHLPWGPPHHKEKQMLLNYEDYIISYDVTSKQPRWVAFKVTKVNRQIPLFTNLSQICWMAETALEEEEMATCKQLLSTDLKHQNLSAVPLFSARFSSSVKSMKDVNVLSNAVLMYKYFQSESMRFLLSVIETRFAKRGQNQLYAFLGPVIKPGNENETPLPVASEFFLILIQSPQPRTRQCDKLNSIAFLVPHRGFKTSCKDIEDFVYSHVVRILDIELKTGLQFLIGCSNKTASVLQRLELTLQ